MVHFIIVFFHTDYILRGKIRIGWSCSISAVHSLMSAGPLRVNVVPFVPVRSLLPVERMMQARGCGEAAADSMLQSRSSPSGNRFYSHNTLISQRYESLLCSLRSILKYVTVGRGY